jgi:U6 snRNA-associated Sm-like protein LSm4
MLPLSLLKTSQGHPMLVELKNGETYNGHLVSCDTWMNVHLREVICTSKDGDRFWRMANCYVRGNTIKYICVPDEVIGLVQEENLKKSQMKPQMGGRGGRGGRGRGEGGRGRGDGGRGGRGGRGMFDVGGKLSDSRRALRGSFFLKIRREPDS